MKLLYGKPVADSILHRLKDDVSVCGEKPGLAVFLVGNDEASHIYVSLKEKAAREIGIRFFRYDLPDTISEQELIEKIHACNQDKEVHGIIVQLPLPQGLDTEKVILTIDPRKDVDGFHPDNVCLFESGNPRLWPVFPHAIVRMTESAQQDLSQKKAVVVANSDEFGSVMIAALRQRDMRAEYVLSGELSLHLELIGSADVLISAVGSPGLITGEMIKEGAIVIDGGIEKVNDKVVGDVDFASMKGKNGFITPVPGGIGPVTIACLLENVYLAFKAQQKEK